MADLEDANAPTWSNMVEGQINVADAIRGPIEMTGPDGREHPRSGPSARVPPPPPRAPPPPPPEPPPPPAPPPRPRPPPCPRRLRRGPAGGREPVRLRDRV